MRTKILRGDGVTEIPNIKSCTFIEQVNADVDLRVGCVSSASISVEVFGEQADAPSVGEALTYYLVDENNNEEKIGIFYAQPTVETRNTYTFTAYDAVSKLDVDFSEHLESIQDDFPMTVMDIVEEAATIAGVTLVSGLTFPLQDISVNAFYQQGITCRQIFSWASEIAGKFVKCNSDGEIIFDWYTTSSNVIAPSDDNNAIYYKQDGLKYENYTTSVLDRVVVYQTNVDTIVHVYPSGVTTGNTYDVSGNLLLIDASDATYTAVAQNIYNVITAIGVYKPFNVNLFPFNAPFRAGEKITVTDSQGVTFTTLAMTVTRTTNDVLVSSTGNEVYASASSSSIAQIYALTENAKESAQTNQYFWFQSTGNEAGAHITQIPKDEFLQEPQGGNTWITSDGVVIRDAQNQLASFSRVGVRIGAENESAMKITSTDVLGVNEDNVPLFRIDMDGSTVELESSETFYLPLEPTGARNTLELSAENNNVQKTVSVTYPNLVQGSTIDISKGFLGTKWLTNSNLFKFEFSEQLELGQSPTLSGYMLNGSILGMDIDVYPVDSNNNRVESISFEQGVAKTEQREISNIILEDSAISISIIVTYSYDGAQTFSATWKASYTGEYDLSDTLKIWGIDVYGNSGAQRTDGQAMNVKTLLDSKSPVFTLGTRKENSTTAEFSTTMGWDNEASGWTAIAGGDNNVASGDSSVALGADNVAAGHDSATIGLGLKTSKQGQVAVGEYNDNQTDTIFEVGNGEYDSNRSNAFAVRRDGGIVFGSGASATKYYIYAITPSRIGRILFAGGGALQDGDGNGTVVGLGAGGLTLVGGGEYVYNRYSEADLADGAEQLYLGSDNNVYIETNGNTIANRKTWSFNADGTITAPSNAIDITGYGFFRFGYSQFLRGYSTSIYLGDEASTPASGDIQWRFNRSNGALQYRTHDGSAWSSWKYPPTTISADDVTSGTFDAARIPTLAIGSKTSGTLAINRGGTGQTAVEEETTISTVITAGTGNTINSVSYNKWGKMVMVNIVFTRSSAIAANATITLGTMKSGYRPKVMATGGSAHYAGHMASGGAITIRNITGASRTPSSDGVTFTFMLP